MDQVDHYRSLQTPRVLQHCSCEGDIPAANEAFPRLLAKYHGKAGGHSFYFLRPKSCGKEF
jgi:hypothetical protein